MSRESRDEGENQPRYPRVKLSHVFEQPIPETRECDGGGGDDARATVSLEIDIVAVFVDS